MNNRFNVNPGATDAVNRLHGIEHAEGLTEVLLLLQIWVSDAHIGVYVRPGMCIQDLGILVELQILKVEVRIGSREGASIRRERGELVMFAFCLGRLQRPSNHLVRLRSRLDLTELFRCRLDLALFRQLERRRLEERVNRDLARVGHEEHRGTEGQSPHRNPSNLPPAETHRLNCRLGGQLLSHQRLLCILCQNNHGGIARAGSGIGGYLTIFHSWQKPSTYEIQQTSN
mmetsp:Transcript_49148/g.117148  ORF Transcript_49148/g.117148 Transcript_49148/m.117148 type:complete len:229 (-) Transcript_49148:29-715(-)